MKSLSFRVPSGPGDIVAGQIDLATHAQARHGKEGIGIRIARPGDAQATYLELFRIIRIINGLEVFLTLCNEADHQEERKEEQAHISNRGKGRAKTKRVGIRPLQRKS